MVILQVNLKTWIVTDNDNIQILVSKTFFFGIKYNLKMQNISRLYRSPSYTWFFFNNLSLSLFSIQNILVEPRVTLLIEKNTV